MGDVISLGHQEITPAPPRKARHRELPPVEHVPILREYGRLGLNKFIEEYAIETKVDDRGFVDYGWLLSYIDSLVDDEFVWKGRLDIHHLQWESGSYNPLHFSDEEDPSIPETLREIPFHKLLIPRDMHDLIHVVTLPPKAPAYEQMKRRVDAYGLAVNLFQKAKQTLDIEAQERRLTQLPAEYILKYNETKEFDPIRRRMIERDVLIDRYLEFKNQFHDQISQTTQQDLDDLINMDILGREDPMNMLVTSLDKAVRLNKRNHAIRPKVRRQAPAQKISA